MKNILTIIKNSRKRNISALIASITIGIILLYTQNSFGVSQNDNFSHMKVAIVSTEDNHFTQGLKNYLSEQIGMEVRTGNSYDDFTDDLLNRELSAIIELPENHYTDSVASRTTLPIDITTLDNYANEGYLKAYLDTYLGGADLVFQAALGNVALADAMFSDIKLASPSIIPFDASLKEKNDSYAGFALSFGFYLNFIWIIGIFIGSTISADRSGGTLLRIQGSPVKSWQYMLGTTGYYMLSAALVPICFLVPLFIQGVEIGVSSWLAALLMIIMQIIVIGTATVFAMAIKSKLGVIISIYAYGALLAILGGAYFDISKLGDSLGKLVKITPTYWFMDCIRNLQSDSAYNPLPNIVILALFAMFTMLLACALFARRSVAAKWE